MNHPTHPGELPPDPNTAADPAHPQGRYEVTTEGYLRSSGEPWNALGNEAHNVRTSKRWLAQLLYWNFEYIRFPGDRAQYPYMQWNIYDHHDKQWLHPTLAHHHRAGKHPCPRRSRDRVFRKASTESARRHLPWLNTETL